MAKIKSLEDELQYYKSKAIYIENEYVNFIPKIGRFSKGGTDIEGLNISIGTKHLSDAILNEQYRLFKEHYSLTRKPNKQYSIGVNQEVG